MSDEQQIRVGTTADGAEAVSLPVVQVLTGRGFVTGKSGSGKSNTASVVVEELLEAGYPVLIVDTDGEYYGLKEAYELLHAGADEECDIQVGAEHAEKIAALALEQNVPIILDVSGYLDEDEADELIRETARHLFTKEKKLKKPFLLVVEEVHEYIPEGAGMGETGRMLIKIGKRGRKHGLGIVGISQRPADVKKDFITQANWLVWHRLTWENDTKVVGRIVGGEYGSQVPSLNAGQAFVQTDWTDVDVRRVQFQRKRTFDAGATPGLDDFERPELKSVSDALVDDLQGITELQNQEQNRVEELTRKLQNRDERIASLENELDSARDISAAARKMANAFAHGDVGEAPASFEEELQEKNDEILRLQNEVFELRSKLDRAEERLAELDPDESVAAGAADAPDDESPRPDAEQSAAEPSATTADSPDDRDPNEGDAVTTADASDDASDDEAGVDPVAAFQAELRRRGERLRRAERRASEADDADQPDPDELLALVAAEPVAVRVAAARRDSQCNETHTRNVVEVLAREGPLTVHDVEPRVDVSVEAIHSLLSPLRARELVLRDADRRYRLNAERMTALVEREDERTELGELREQWRPY